MFFVSRVLRALSIASLRADFSERSLVVVVPFDSDLKKKRLKDLPMPLHHLSSSSSRREIFLFRA